MQFLHEYLFKIRHRRTVLCEEKTRFAYVLCISVGRACFLFLILTSESVAIIRLSGYSRSIRLSLKCEILVLNFFPEEFVRSGLSVWPLMKPFLFTPKGWQLEICLRIVRL